ncbi:hypothetical protein HRbin02_00982 [Candidatus Calditenuaceae archaeon HR02]|nr:hypothetical protein HRbin02_00982 [Candidatus Calditenuaceae archaeon HR02]
MKDVLAAELFTGEDPWSYSLSDYVNLIIVGNKFILITSATIKDRTHTYIVNLELPRQ